MSRRKDGNGGVLPKLLGGKPQPVRILAIDGGGIRGLLPALVLAEIERLCDKPVAELFDLVAGTSSGALVGLGLVTPNEQGAPKYKAQEIVRLYEVGSARVFSRTMWHQIKAVGNLVDEKYPASGMDEVLHRVFGDTLLSEALTDTLVTSYEIERRIPFLFRTRYAKDTSGYDFPMTQVVRAATAAPTYFEPAHIPTNDGHDYYALVDGAVFAYNPALCAYVEAMKIYPDAKDFVMVSLGTGQLTRRLPYEDAKDWGAARWAQPLFSLMCDGAAAVTDHQMSCILTPAPNGQPRYFRFQVRLDTGSDDMDDSSHDNMRTIKLLGQDLILQNREVLAELAAVLVE